MPTRDQSAFRLGRHRAAGLAAVPAVVMAAISLGRAAWAVWIHPHPTWDDHALVGVAWGMAALGMVVLVESVAAVIAPARWYPRWLAILVLLTAAGVGIYAGVTVLMAASFGP